MKKEQIKRSLEIAKHSLESIDIGDVELINVEVKRDAKEVPKITPYYSNSEIKSVFEIRITVEEK
jgi:hypothetical protein